MALSEELIQEFTTVLDDRPKKTLETTCYGKAVFDGGEGFVILDGAESRTPATFTVPAHENDRVLVLLKNRKALVIGNITHPVIMTGTLYASDGVIVEGYLTTNKLRTTYNNRVHEGLTFDSNGLGAYGSDGYWYVTTSGSLYVEQATVKGDLYAYSGEIGGFVIDQTSIHTKNKDITLNDSSSLGLSSAGFTRTVAGESRSNLMLAIGSGFGVNKDGTLYATGASISGAITATSLSLSSGVQIPASTGVSGLATVATSGSYDDLVNKIDKTAVVTVNDSGIINIQKNNGVAKAGTITKTYGTTVKGFQISTDGLLEASNAVIYGAIYSSAGMIGGWGIENSRISTTYTANNTTYYIGMGTPGSQAFYAGATNQNGSNGVFRVDHLGNLTATSATITGSITATSLSLGSGVQISASTGVSGLATVATSGKYSDLSNKPDLTVYIAKDGTVGSTPAAGANGFKVASSGALTASNVVVWGSIYASGGTIAGWTIGSNKLTKNTLGANDSIHLGTADLGTATIADKSLSTWRLAVGSGFGVDKNGVLYAKGATITGSITATSLTLNSGVKIPASTGVSGLSTVATSGKYTDLSSRPDLTIYIAKDGTIGTVSDGTNGIKISSAGVLSASNATIFGTIYASAGTIGGLTLSGNTMYTAGHDTWNKSANGVFISGATTADYPISAGSGGAFRVSNTGDVTCTKSVTILPAATGTIGYRFLDSSNVGIGGLFSNLNDVSLEAGRDLTISVGRDINMETSTGGIVLGGWSITCGAPVTVNDSLNVTGNIVCGSSSSTSGQFVKVWNNKHQGSIHVDTSGKLGIYSDTKSCWTMYIDANGDFFGRILQSSRSDKMHRLIGSTDKDGCRVALLKYGDQSGSTKKIQFWAQTGTSGSSYDWRTPEDSDIRLKKNIKESTVDSLSILNKVKLYSFDWKDGSPHWDIGFIANYIVDADPNLADITTKEHEYSSINTFYMQGHIVKAIQQLTDRIKYLENELEKVKGAA